MHATQYNSKCHHQNLRFAPTPSLRPPLATLSFVETRPYALISSLTRFLCFLRFPQVVFSVEIELSCSKNYAADCKN
ncbi:hypothetical protein TNCV_3050341 [Trichonephila clavipes]|nr:hypothetical protein TNCV_3050341 [Trichonephila clavipes]